MMSHEGAPKHNTSHCWPHIKHAAGHATSDHLPRLAGSACGVQASKTAQDPSPGSSCCRCVHEQIILRSASLTWARCDSRVSGLINETANMLLSLTSARR